MKNVDTVVVDDGRTDVVAVEEEHEVGQENVSSPRAHSLQYPWCQSQQENIGHQMLLDLQQIF